jgi:transaldolase
MKIFLDTANISEIREIAAWGILDGVTTNPSLIAKNGGDFIETIYEIAELVQGPVSAEVIAPDTDGMVREGRLLARVHEHVVVKVPLTSPGLAAVKALHADGIRTNVTLCFHPVQALLAAKAGATYISPFVGRVDDISWSGGDLIQQIVDIYANYPDLSTQVLAASIRHPLHVVESALSGAHVATIPYGVMKRLLDHPLTDIGNEKFLADWATVKDTDIEGQVQRWLAKRGR